MWQEEPVIAERGVMLDISRDRVPNARGLDDLQQLAQQTGLNQVQLYSEHAIAYQGHEAVTTPQGHLTLAELGDFATALARDDISLVGNQNILGHAERWLQHPVYAPLAEMPDAAARIAAGSTNTAEFLSNQRVGIGIGNGSRNAISRGYPGKIFSYRWR